jgi:hypothetical protein
MTSMLDEGPHVSRWVHVLQVPLLACCCGKTWLLKGAWHAQVGRVRLEELEKTKQSVGGSEAIAGQQEPALRGSSKAGLGNVK